MSPDEINRRAAMSACTGCVVVGHDGSRQADAAVLWGATYAAAVRVPLTVVRAFTVAEAWQDVRSEHHDYVPALDELVDAVRQHLRADVATLMAGTGPPAEVVAVHADPAGFFLDTSAGAVAVVLGADRRGPVAGVLLGSVVPRLVADAGCPVVVVPESREPETGRR